MNGGAADLSSSSYLKASSNKIVAEWNILLPGRLSKCPATPLLQLLGMYQQANCILSSLCTKSEKQLYIIALAKVRNSAQVSADDSFERRYWYASRTVRHKALAMYCTPSSATARLKWTVLTFISVLKSLINTCLLLPSRWI